LADLSRRVCLAVLLSLCGIAQLLSAESAAACDLSRVPAPRWSVHTNGVDWLVDPCGERFYSLGVNVLDSEVPKLPLPDGRTRYEWRRFYPSGTPVTILYSDLIASLLGRLRHVRNWNADVISTSFRTSRWFL